MTLIYDVLRRPILTEKSSHQYAKLNQYVFEVANNATKSMITEAVETIFNVKVVQVNTMVMPAKRSRRAQSRRVLVRRSAYKKAVVTLSAGDSISVFEGVR